jgi:hypothetical protein
MFVRLPVFCSVLRHSYWLSRNDYHVCLSQIIAVEGPRIFFCSVDWTYEFEHHTWHIRMSSLFCVLMYVYSFAVGAYFFRVLSTVIGFTISGFIVYHSRCNKGYPAGLFVNIGMRSMLLATSHVVWVIICFVYWVSTVVRKGYEIERYN